MNLSVNNFKTLGVFWLSTAAVRCRQNGGFKISPQENHAQTRCSTYEKWK